MFKHIYIIFALALVHLDILSGMW